MRYIIFILSVLFSFNANAGHIMGGEMFYEYLGNDEYRITVRQFLQTGDLQGTIYAQADADITIIIYNAAGTSLIQTLDITQGTVVPFSNSKTDPCTGAQFDIIESQAVDFVQTVTLPSIPGGYLLTYYRCCRKDDMTNMAIDQGYGIEVYIPELDVVGENDLPVFSNVPPTFICVGDSFKYDQHAVDNDGDELVYSICETKVAGDPFNMIYFDPDLDIAPATHTFYSNAIWNAGFAASDPLGNGSVSIDQNNGVITGFADQIGKFVVSICVSEYRNGNLLNTVIRDFLVVATEDCPEFTAGELSTGSDFFPNVCGNRAEFENNSKNATGYFWDFGVDENDSDTSIMKNPIYYYKEAGDYIVTFIAYDSISQCSDTIIASVKIEMPQAAFSFTGICKKDPIEFSNNSIPANNTGIIAVEYIFGDGTTSGQVSPTQTVTHVYPKSGVWKAGIVAIDSMCGIDTSFQSILVPQTADANFSLVSNIGAIGVPIDITNDSKHYQSLDWDFDGTSMSGHIEGEVDLGLEAGEYEFILTANDPNPDCTTYDTAYYKVSKAAFAIPNAFSPNGDGKNDVLNIIAIDVTDFHMVIYNRWGEKMYESTDPDGPGWDGTYQDKFVVAGMYPYEATGVNVDTGEPYDMAKGSIIVIR